MIAESTPLHGVDLRRWDADVDAGARQRAAAALETGGVVFFPHLPFILQAEERRFLTPACIKPGTKNVSYDRHTGRISGTVLEGEERGRLAAMMARFSAAAQSLIGTVFPCYRNGLITARTSFRPVAAQGRSTSYRKDDTRLHVDAFPSTPVYAKRILRLFSNVNPAGEPRIWRIGEPFENVARRFLPKARPYSPRVAALWKTLRVTRSKRSAYDHYMLQLHDLMKADTAYQREVQQQELPLPAQSSWLVFTDQTSHAVMRGQYLLEQSFYLPVDSLVDPARSPLKTLEKLIGRPLL